ncbi:NAD-dependent epimerase/dehydratase family protein [Blautia sp. HCP3S3_D9]|uniref:NAD-dependent epimerase/dehydratase family protein n=1 Tax=Blautia sp. HCP3S3_D9 TaxID=3438912 RepID=UPI003F8AC486
MRVFITGVAGFMGSHLADKLIANGEDVVGVDNLVGGTLDNVNPQVEFYEEDCVLTSHYFPTQTLKTLINTELFVILLVDK